MKIRKIRKGCKVRVTGAFTFFDETIRVKELSGKKFLSQFTRHEDDGLDVLAGIDAAVILPHGTDGVPRMQWRVGGRTENREYHSLHALLNHLLDFYHCQWLQNVLNGEQEISPDEPEIAYDMRTLQLLALEGQLAQNLIAVEALSAKLNNSAGVFALADDLADLSNGVKLAIHHAATLKQEV